MSTCQGFLQELRHLAKDMDIISRKNKKSKPIKDIGLLF